MKLLFRTVLIAFLALTIVSCSDDSTEPSDEPNEVVNIQIDGDNINPGDTYYNTSLSNIRMVEFLDDKEFAKNVLTIQFPLLGENPEVTTYDVVVNYEEVRGESTTPDLNLWSYTTVICEITKISDGYIHGEFSTTVELIEGVNEDTEKDISGNFVLEVRDIPVQ